MIATLIVEDDRVLAEAHRTFTQRVPGFRDAGAARLGAEALRLVSTEPLDLLLLDVNLPDMTGIELCRRLRASGSEIDIIAVTSARDLSTVHAAASLGVLQYLLKPFSFASFRDKLQAYAEYRRLAGQAPGTLAQTDVDRAFAALHDRRSDTLPKGLTEPTLAAVIALLRSGPPSSSAAEAAAAVGISAQTARRYLAYLTTQRLAAQQVAYGGTGRPEHTYRWIGR
jgi:response regulator of citrate/malate metabolism